MKDNENQTNVPNSKLRLTLWGRARESSIPNVRPITNKKILGPTQNQSLFQAEHFRPKSCCLIFLLIRSVLDKLVSNIVKLQTFGLKLEVDFVFPLSQEQQKQEQPLTKIYGYVLQVWNLAYRPFVFSKANCQS